MKDLEQFADRIRQRAEASGGEVRTELFRVRADILHLALTIQMRRLSRWAIAVSCGGGLASIGLNVAASGLP